MARYFVTRHPGAREWARARGLDAEMVEHLDVERVRRGDVVMGTLPVHVAAEVCARGARFLHLSLDAPEGERGTEMTADAMAAAGAHLVAYDVLRLDDPAPASPKPPSVAERIRRMLVRAGDRAWHVLTFLLGFTTVTLLVLTQGGMLELVGQAVTATVETDPAGRFVAMHWSDRAADPLGFALALFVFGALIAYIPYRLRHRLLSSVIRRSDDIPPKRVLIQGLSPLPDLDGADVECGGESRGYDFAVGPDRRDPEALETAKTLPLWALALPKDAARNPQGYGLSPELQAKLEKLGRFPWRQNLRAIARHVERVEQVIILTSRETNVYFETFVQLADSLLRGAGRRVSFHRAPGSPADFEDYEATMNAFRGPFVSPDVTAGRAGTRSRSTPRRARRSSASPPRSRQ